MDKAQIRKILVALVNSALGQQDHAALYDARKALELEELEDLEDQEHEPTPSKRSK